MTGARTQPQRAAGGLPNRRPAGGRRSSLSSPAGLTALLYEPLHERPRDAPQPDHGGEDGPAIDWDAISNAMGAVK